MAKFSQIDIAKSISTGRLAGSRDLFDKFDCFFSLFLIIFLIVPPVLLFYHLNWNDVNEKAFGLTLFPLFFLLGLYMLYRKLTETRLIKIETSLKQHKNKTELLHFLKEKGYNISRENKEIITVIDEEEFSYNMKWVKIITFIIIDNCIYFTVVKNYPKTNPPVFFTHLFLKKDLKKHFAATAIYDTLKKAG